MISPAAPEGALDTIASELRDERTELSAHVVDPPEPGRLGLLVAAGPRTREHPGTYALVIESIREGYLLHYGAPRLLDPPDRDLALLAGDYLYAKGLERLAALADLEAVRELSDLIALSAQLHAGDEGTAERAAALWLSCAVAVAAGASSDHRAAKRALVADESGQGLFAAAEAAATAANLDEQLVEAAEAVGFSPPTRG